MTKKSKVSVLLTGLGVIGVVVTAVLAVKNYDIYKANLEDAEHEKDSGMSDEEFEDFMTEQGVTEPSEVEYLTKKEKAVIFAKSCYPALIAGLVTEGCIVGAQVLDIHEIAVLTGACTALAYKYEDAKNYIQKNYPEQYKDFQNFIDSNSAKRHFEEKPLKKEETYDGRIRYYEPETMQDIFMTNDQLIDLQHYIDTSMATEMGITLNEILYYIKENFDKNVKVPVKVYPSWGLPDDRCPEKYDFVKVSANDISDIKDKDGDTYVARVLRFESWDDPFDEDTK